MTAALLILAFAVPPKAQPAATFEQTAASAARARDSNRLDEAARLYREAVRMKPDWKEGWWYLGTLEYDQDHYPQCRDAFRKFTALEEKLGPGWALLGLCEFETKEYDRSLADLARAESAGLAAKDSLTNVARYHEALLFNRIENFERALQISTQLIEQGNSEPATLAAAGMAALRMPVLPAELKPENREIVMLAGQAVSDIANRRPPQALADLEGLVSKYPKTPNVHYFYGTYLMLGDADKGVIEYKKELEISPGHVPALVGLALEYQKRGDSAEALRYAREGVKAGPRLFVTHDVLGRELVEAGHLDEGIRELEAARELAPDSPQTHVALASAYAKAGRAEDAAKERREFTRLEKLVKRPGAE